MSLPLRQYKAQTKKIRPRTKPRRQKAIRCRPHVDWVIGGDWRCILAGKVSKITGKPHVCCGRLDPHHSPTRGAGGGDNNISPICRAGHDLLDSWDRSEQSVEEEYGVSFGETGDSLWEASPFGKQYRMQERRRLSAAEGPSLPSPNS